MCYFSTEEIIERAKEKIIPLNSQQETINNITALLSLHLKKLNALENGAETDFLPTLSELIIAPTGSGKTYLISKLAEAANLPFYTIDCSMLLASGENSHIASGEKSQNESKKKTNNTVKVIGL